jgi:hypothetical protein
LYNFNEMYWEAPKNVLSVHIQLTFVRLNVLGSLQKMFKVCIELQLKIVKFHLKKSLIYKISIENCFKQQ